LPLADRNVMPVLPHELAPDHVPARTDARATPARIARGMAAMYNAAGLPALRCTIQLCFAGVDAGGEGESADWFLHVNDDRCDAHPGTTPFPTLRIRTPLEVWASVGAGELDPEQAFSEGRYEADGSIELLKLLPRLFAYPRPSA
jgi:hypothetical protein